MRNPNTNAINMTPCWMDFLSFEAMFILFFLSGTYKSYEKLEAINSQYDITATTTILCFVAGAILYMSRKSPTLRPIRAYFLFFLVYLALAVLSYFTGGIFSDNANLKIQKLLIFNTCALALPLFLINTRVRIERLVRLFFAASVFMGFDSVLRTQTEGFSRFVGSFGTDGYQALGITSAMGVELALIVLLFEKKLFLRYVFAVIAAVLMIAVMLAGARQALAGLIISVLFIAYSLSKTNDIAKHSARYLAGACLLVIAFFVVRTSVLPKVDTSWGSNRLFAIFGEEGNDVLADSYRPMLWSAGLDVWSQYPIFGAGFGSFSEVSSFPESRQPHNMFIEMMCEMGLVGLFVGCAFWWVPFRQIMKRSRSAADPLMLSLGALLIHLATCAQFSGDVTDHRQMFTFAGLILSLAASHNAQMRRTNSQLALRQRESYDGLRRSASWKALDIES